MDAVLDNQVYFLIIIRIYCPAHFMPHKSVSPQEVTIFLFQQILFHDLY